MPSDLNTDKELNSNQTASKSVSSSSQTVSSTSTRSSSHTQCSNITKAESSSTKPGTKPSSSSLVTRYRTTLGAISARTGTALPSLVTSFVVLHEATAVIPLVGVFFACRSFGIGKRIVSLPSSSEYNGLSGIVKRQELGNDIGLNNSNNIGKEGLGSGDDKGWVIGVRDRWLAEGEAWVGRVGRYYGIFGFEKTRSGSTSSTSPRIMSDEERIAVAADVANAVIAYCATKALLPVRVGLSLYLAPSFSRRLLDPAVRRLAQLSKKFK